jgi:hypothetical protein
MQQPQELHLQSLLEESHIERRALLPLWIKIFTWLFLFCGAAAVVGAVFMLFGFSFQVALYGLQSNEVSLTALIVTMLFLLKGVAAIGLWRQRDWGVNVAIVDAVLGIAVCAFMMVVYPFLVDNGAGFQIRLELALLIPYLMKLYNIRPTWNKARRS